jgi:hypothetical protein
MQIVLLEVLPGEQRLLLVVKACVLVDWDHQFLMPVQLGTSSLCQCSFKCSPGDLSSEILAENVRRSSGN